jgi:hypothetical protein
MKFFTLLFSFYMLGLSFMPCGDVNECKASTEVITAGENGHDKHSHDTENCSPLCACACCATTVCFQQIVTYQVATITFPVKKYSLYDFSYSSQSTANIWQPPRA